MRECCLKVSLPPMSLAVIIFISCFGSLILPSSPATTNLFDLEFTKDRMKLRSKDVQDYVTERGYPFESHIITTADGYLLTYHRVPKASEAVEAERGTEEPHRHPVLLVHGILQSSAFFLAIQDGLAYKLADAGFDVWLANHRGNPYSKAHLHLNPRRHSKYWEFSFDEMGRYDLPAAIDFILELTKRRSLSYVGFSMGTTMFWVLADSWPSYMSRVDLMIAMAPIARPSGLKMVMKRSTYGFVTTVLKALSVLQFYEFRPYNRKNAFFVQIPCKKILGMEKHLLCRFIVKIVCKLAGMDENLLNYKGTLGSLNFMSAGSSVQSLYHLLQVGSASKFQMYDHGDRLNMKYYGGITTPPTYDLTKVTIPVYLIQGGKDEFSVVSDTHWLMEELNVHGQATLLFEKEVADYNHLDFFFANEVNKKLYTPLVTELNKVATSLVPHMARFDVGKDGSEMNIRGEI